MSAAVTVPAKSLPAPCAAFWLRENIDPPEARLNSPVVDAVLVLVTPAAAVGVPPKALSNSTRASTLATAAPM